MRLTFKYNGKIKKFSIDLGSLTVETESEFTQGTVNILFNLKKGLVYYYDKIIDFTTFYNEDDKKLLYDDFHFFVAFLNQLSVAFFKYHSENEEKQYKDLSLRLYTLKNRKYVAMNLLSRIIGIIRYNNHAIFDDINFTISINRAYLEYSQVRFMLLLGEICKSQEIPSQAFIDSVFFDKHENMFKFLSNLLEQTKKTEIENNNKSIVASTYIQNLMNGIIASAESKR